MSESTPSSITFDTPHKIEYFRLATCKSFIRMESVGFKSRRGSVRLKMNAELGLPPRAKHEVTIAHIEARLAVLRKLIGEENVQTSEH